MNQISFAQDLGEFDAQEHYSYMNDASSLVAACGDESDTLFVNILKVNLFIMECSLIDFYCCTVVGSLYSM